MKTRTVNIIFLALAAALLLAGCQSGEEASSSPQTVEERAQARWDRLIAGEYAEAWEYFTPGYRETSPADQFTASIQRRPVEWQEAVVVESACEEVRCEIVVDVTYSVPRAASGLSSVSPTRPIRETWIRTDGNWWFAPEN